ncbi:peptidoglycan bridge formation glycyltransferase FemA/FemB family protein, partial [bacterium]|nr:peptidoglycan bridge formation glycyltransferase FemA/FemB family protein [bacterium]
IKDKEIWEDFFLDYQEKTFLQSWYWGEFQKRMGNRIFRLGIFKEDELISPVLVTKITAKRGTFLLIQHGPVIKSQISNLKSQNKLVLETLLKYLKELAKKEKASFIRIAPLWKRNEENIKIFKDLKFREAPLHASAYEATWKLDITPNEEELLKNMRKTTRYLIKKTSNNPDIEVVKSKNLEDIKIYQKLNREVAKRQKFTPFSDEFIKNEFEVFTKEDKAILILGKYKDEIVAGALIIFWSGIGFYHQAASSKEYAKYSLPYLIQWEAIKEAKKRKCELYDFWGYVDPFKNKKHPWAGPSLFKMGFGGKKYEYVKTQDFILSLKYWPIFLFEKIRKFKRGL